MEKGREMDAFALCHFSLLRVGGKDGGWQALVGMAPWPQPGCANLAKTMDVMVGDGMNVVGGKTGGLAPSVRQDGEWRELVKLACEMKYWWCVFILFLPWESSAHDWNMMNDVFDR